MIKTFFCCLILILPPSLCFAWPAKVVEIIRADEFKARTAEGIIERIRFYGIDAPIEPQAFGREAKLYVERRILGRTVEIEPLIRDHYDRVIAWVSLDKVSINRELLSQGIVWWYSKYVPWETELAELQEQAKKARLGLWSLPHPVPPWEYQPLMSAEPADQFKQPGTESVGTRGSVRDRMIKEFGQSRKIIGAEGSVRDRLLNRKIPRADQAVQPEQ